MEFPNGSLPEKYQRRRKQFVEVVAEYKLDGTTLPRMITLADGRRYEVEICGEPFSLSPTGETRKVTVYPIRRAGGNSDKAKFAASDHRKGNLTYLFESSQRWYVLMKT